MTAYIDTKINRIITNTNRILTILNNPVMQRQISQEVNHIISYNDIKSGYKN